MSGPKLAALYGLIPNQLGFCGPRQEKLKDFIAGKLSTGQIIPILKQFEAAYPYYQLIARKNRAKPFDKKVIEAYWLGNKYLDKVKINDLRELIIKKFSAPGLLTKELATQKASVIPPDSKPHHSFHVMVLGSVTGRVNFAGKTKLQDACRVGWGKVIKKLKIKSQKSKLTIVYDPLVGKKQVKFGKSIKKDINWNKDILPSIDVGDWVSFHWNYAIQKLNEENIINLHKYTQNTLDALHGKK